MAVAAGLPAALPFRPDHMPIGSSRLWFDASSLADGNVGAWVDKGPRGVSLSTTGGTPTKANGRVSYKGGAAHVIPNQANQFRDYRWMLIIFGVKGVQGTGASYLLYVNGYDRTKALHCQPLVQFDRISGVCNVEHNNNAYTQGANRATAPTAAAMDGTLHFMLIRRKQRGLQAGISVDGGPEAVNATGTAFVPLNGSDAGKIGGDVNLQLDLAHLVQGQDELTDDFAARLQGWAAWECVRLGSPNPLPAGHPYASAPPTIAPAELPAAKPRPITTDAAWDKLNVGYPFYTHQGEPLRDISTWTRTFRADFDGADAATVVGNEAGGVSKLYAQGEDNVGAGALNDVTIIPPPGPYYQVAHDDTLGRGYCRLMMQRTSPTAWTGASMQTVNRNGYGYSQMGGYMEVEARGLDGTADPTYPPACWTIWGRTMARYLHSGYPIGELDLMEQYGYYGRQSKFAESWGANSLLHGPVYSGGSPWDPAGFGRGVGDEGVAFRTGHPLTNPATSIATACGTKQPLDGNLHTWGVLFDLQAGVKIIYFNRIELLRYPMVAEDYAEFYLICMIRISADDRQADGTTRMAYGGPFYFDIFSVSGWKNPADA